MRWSNFYLFTTREVPAEAEVVSHRLMIRAGLIKKVAAGIYTYLPFGWRSLQKLTAIVQRELGAAGALELSMPTVQPAELWQETGRWQRYGKELLRLEDRHGRGFCYAPTAEEVITDLVRHDVRSYRQLPLNLYQIQSKFRDEIRPRFGLMRGREFLMKDGYSFHASQESLDSTYEAMRQAYCRIFEACGLDYSVVEADSGAIGGSSSHEFMVVARTGESAVVRSPSGAYSANTEKAVCAPLEQLPEEQPLALEEVPTPGQSTIEEVASFLDVDARRTIKTLLYTSETEETVAVLVRGDREINEVKLGNLLDVDHLVLATEEVVRQLTGAEVGYAGPVGLAGKARIIADESVRGISNIVCGANKTDTHLRNVNLDRDAQVDQWADLLLVGAGDPSVDGSGPLEEFRGIEVGHIFDLGRKYSEAMGCSFLDQEGKSHAMTMGCYGLGIGRTVAAAIEQNHDEDGIQWPLPLAPFQVLLIALNPKEAEVQEAAEKLYSALQEQGVDVLYDDRKERPGVKFKDADLIGIPVRLVVGKKALADGQVEISLRRDREKQLTSLNDAVERVVNLARG